MVKVEVLEEFSLGKFNELKNVERCSTKEQYGKLFKGDKFDCSKEMYEYLNGKNPLNKVVVKLIGVEPKDEIDEDVVGAVATAIKEQAKEDNKKVNEIVDEFKEEKPKKRTSKKKVKE
jgi:hypothetical protein